MPAGTSAIVVTADLQKVARRPRFTGPVHFLDNDHVVDMLMKSYFEFDLNLAE
jgi:hypothetical protein